MSILGLVLQISLNSINGMQELSNNDQDILFFVFYENGQI